ncbi:MAG: class I SAM-dependent methyltransferase [Pseudomonadota bacterium]
MTELDQEAQFGRQYAERHRFARTYATPMLQGTGRNLSTMRALEIGCGEGPKSTALAPLFASFTGVDLDGPAIKKARTRAETLGVENVEFLLLEANDLPSLMGERQFDVIFLYAVLEHLTVQERLDTLKLCWEHLPPEGLLYVGEAPNRAAPVDYHSSHQAGFHHLPVTLAEKRFERSDNENWKTRVKSEDTLELGFFRNGQHVGFEEFDLAVAPLAELKSHILRDNWTPEMLNLYPLRWFEARQLRDLPYLAARRFTSDVLPAAFARYWIEFILAKTAPETASGALFPVEPRAIEMLPAGRDFLNNEVYEVTSTAPMVFGVGPRIEELLIGFDAQSKGTVIVQVDGATVLELDADARREEAASAWDIQTWTAVPLPPSRGGRRRKVRILTKRRGKFGLLAPLLRQRAQPSEAP